MKKRLTLPLLFLFFLSTLPNIFAQRGCGTPPEKSAWLIEYQQNPAGYPKSNNILYAPLTVHIVGTNSGDGHYRLGDLFEMICQLNEYFEASEIQFFLEGDVNFINNTAYYDHEGYGPGASMMEQNNVPATINCYIVENPDDNCGYYNGWGVALKKSCVQSNDPTWAHEIGHYLSLPHPFIGWEGVENPDYTVPAPNFLGFGNQVEKVDGSNCHTAGDGFCDTPPDYLADRWNCNGSSTSIIEQTDPNGETFRSDGTLFMSYSNNACSNRFSEEQIAAMRANLLDDRSYLLDNQSPGAQIEDPSANLISPMNGEQMANNTNILFEWEAVEGATGYLVHVNPLPTFGGTIFHRYHTRETSFVLPDELIPNRIYFWEIRPYNPIHTCAGSSITQTFVTGGGVTNDREIREINSFRLAPNPVTNGQEVQLIVQVNQAFESSLTIVDITGRILFSKQQSLSLGDNQMQVPTSNLSAGVYFVGLESASGRRFEKLVIGDW